MWGTSGKQIGLVNPIPGPVIMCRWSPPQPSLLIPSPLPCGRHCLLEVSSLPLCLPLLPSPPSDTVNHVPPHTLPAHLPYQRGVMA